MRVELFRADRDRRTDRQTYRSFSRFCIRWRGSYTRNVICKRIKALQLFPKSQQPPVWPGPPHYQGFTIILRHTTLLMFFRPCIMNCLYRESQEEWTKFREGVPYVKIYRYNPKHLYPKLNGYGDKGQKKVWSFCGSTYCTWFAWSNTHKMRIVRPCLQLAQARSSLWLHM